MEREIRNYYWRKNKNIIIDSKDANKLGLKLSEHTRLVIEQKPTISIDSLVNNIKYYLDVNQLVLNISVPQISLVKSEVGWLCGSSELGLWYTCNYSFL